MEINYFFVIGGCLLGALQIAAGIAIGLWMRRSGYQLNPHSDTLQARELARDLQKLTEDVSISVDEHRNSLLKASQMLDAKTDAKGQVPAELLVGVVGNILQSNHALQQKLDSAETRLDQQEVEIEAYMSRSVTDALTSLPNRRGFDEQLKEQLSNWRKQNRQFSLLLLDVDHFKALNDKYGHLAGDRVLSEVGRALRDVLRQYDTVARYGGEEFAMLLPNTSLAQAAVVVKKVLNAIANVKVQVNDLELSITTSGGLTTILPGDNEESLVNRADEALYAAKEAGRRRAYLHDGEQCVAMIDCIIAEADSPDPFADEDESLKSLASISNWFSHVLQEDPEALISDAEEEPISAELAKSCEELLRCIEEHDWQAESPIQSPA